MPDADYTKWIKPESIADKIIELLSENISAPDGGTIRMY